LWAPVRSYHQLRVDIRLRATGQVAASRGGDSTKKAESKHVA